MEHKLPELPYKRDALAPYISKETLDYHYGKHHAAYVDKLNKLIPGTEFENLPLKEIVKKSSGGIFNNAAQVWNHTFFWNCLKPNGGGEPKDKIMDAITKSFGSFDKFKEQFAGSCLNLFGSGWVWLVKNNEGSLSIESKPNAETPLKEGKKAVLTCDVWEHAYYIDYRNARAAFIEAFFKLVNWDFAESNLS